MKNRSHWGMVMGRMICSLGLLGVVAGCQPDEQTVRIHMEEFRIYPDRLRLFSNQPIRFFITNRGREPHIFQSTFLREPTLWMEKDGEPVGFERTSGIPLDPRESVELVFRAQPGVWEIKCSIKGHQAMRGMVIVTSPNDPERNG